VRDGEEGSGRRMAAEQQEIKGLDDKTIIALFFYFIYGIPVLTYLVVES
jgi:hypothetical protein